MKHRTTHRNQAAGRCQPDAQQKKSPLTADAKVLEVGKSIFKNKCQKCHGPAGLGDGPDADPDHAEDMDLTKASRAAKNPEGVMFYKVSNGRKKPKMPAFKEQLNETADLVGRRLRSDAAQVAVRAGGSPAPR